MVLIMKDIYSKIAGVSFGNRQQYVASLCIGDEIEAVRDRHNEYDANAIALYDKSGNKLGFIRKELAEKIAPIMDSGIGVCVFVEDVTGGGEDYNFGVNIRIEFHDYNINGKNLISILIQNIYRDLFGGNAAEIKNSPYKWRLYMEDNIIPKTEQAVIESGFSFPKIISLKIVNSYNVIYGQIIHIRELLDGRCIIDNITKLEDTIRMINEVARIKALQMEFVDEKSEIFGLVNTFKKILRVNDVTIQKQWFIDLYIKMFLLSRFINSAMINLVKEPQILSWVRRSYDDTDVFLEEFMDSIYIEINRYS